MRDYAFYNAGCENTSDRRRIMVLARRLVRRILRPIFLRQVDLYQDQDRNVETLSLRIDAMARRHDQLEAFGWDHEAMARRLAALEDHIENLLPLKARVESLLPLNDRVESYKDHLESLTAYVDSVKDHVDFLLRDEEARRPPPHPFTFREGTTDEQVFLDVNDHDEYRLPKAFEPNDLIVDVGCHIGSFAYACLVRGAGSVHGFEAFSENYDCAVRNLRSFGDRIKLQNKAVWRSDTPIDSLSYSISGDGNTGGGHVLGTKGGRRVDAISLDDLIREVTDDGRRRIRLLKMDCEGSEYPILLTSRMLHLVDFICGEFHNYTISHGRDHAFYKVPEHARIEGYSRYTIDELADYLEDANFHVDPVNNPHLPGLTGWFFARNNRRSSLPALLAG